jgi:glycosyltransferase involved in cell wall biosynthesis
MIHALVDDYFPYKFTGGAVSFTRCSRSPGVHELVQARKLLRLAPGYDVVLVCRKYGKYLGWIWPHQQSPFAKLVAYEFIYSRHENRLHSYVSRLIWRSIRGFDRVFVQARSDITFYSGLFGVSGSTFAYVPISAHVSESSYVGPIADGYVFSAGRSGRDYTTLLEALHGMSVPCVIVGSVHDGILASVSTDSGTTVYLDIPRERYLELLGGACIVVVPLDAEQQLSAGQVVALEAMALGKPLIVTDMPYVTDYVHSKYSVLVPPKDSAALSAAIADLYHGPFERLVHMGRAGYEFGLTHFSTHQFQKRFEYEIAKTLGVETLCDT